jgi:hypothetical protein
MGTGAPAPATAIFNKLGAIVSAGLNFTILSPIAKISIVIFAGAVGIPKTRRPVEVEAAESPGGRTVNVLYVHGQVGRLAGTAEKVTSK